MKIKRKFTYIGAARRFRVYINEEHVEHLKVLRTIELEQPSEPFTLSFKTMMVEESLRYRIDTNQELYITANVNPWVRLFTFGIYMIFLTILFSIPTLDILMAIAFILLALVIYLVVYYTFLVKRYIICKVYDMDGNKIPVTIQKKEAE